MQDQMLHNKQLNPIMNKWMYVGVTQANDKKTAKEC